MSDAPVIDAPAPTIEQPKARLLTRSLPFEIERADGDNDGLTLTGYAAVFDTPTRIDSWEGTFDEQIARGAFKRTLTNSTPVLQFDHGRHGVFGSLPLGVFTNLREDRQGLKVEARLHASSFFEPVREAIQSGSITGMSFRFRVVKDRWDETGKVPLRTIRDLDCFEAGPVVFPAYPTTSVGVRSLIDRLSPDELDELRQALALGVPLDDPALEATRETEPETQDPALEATPGDPIQIARRAHALRALSLGDLL